MRNLCYGIYPFSTVREIVNSCFNIPFFEKTYIKVLEGLRIKEDLDSDKMIVYSHFISDRQILLYTRTRFSLLSLNFRL